MRTPILLTVLGLTLSCATTSGSRAATGETVPSRGSVGSARQLPAGPAVAFAIGCEADLYVGPFGFRRSGESVRLASTIRNPSGEQVCSVTAHWVDQTGGSPSVAGIGCTNDTEAVAGELVHEYSPDNGGSNVNPVYLHVERHDPAGCQTVELTLARR